MLLSGSNHLPLNLPSWKKLFLTRRTYCKTRSERRSVSGGRPANSSGAGSVLLLFLSQVRCRRIIMSRIRAAIQLLPMMARQVHVSCIDKSRP